MLQDKVKDYYQKRYNELVLSKLDSVSVLKELKLIAAERALEEDFDIHNCHCNYCWNNFCCKIE